MKRSDALLPSRGIPLALLALLALAVEPQAFCAERPLNRNSAVVIRLDGMISPFNRAFVERQLKEAQKDAVDIVIIEIDSPGGIVDDGFKIADMLVEVDWAETVAYIPSTSVYGALSAATFVSLGCDRIVIGERAMFGDAGVIFPDETNAFRYVPEKELTHEIGKLRTLAELHGRPPALAEAMVRKNLDVYHVRNTKTGEETCMSDKELAAAKDADDWEKGKPVQESLDSTFLEVNGKRAVELGLADANAESREELFKQLNVVGTPKVVKWSAVDWTVITLNNPFITALLFIIGLIALYIEMSSPGIGMGLLTAALCFALFFWSRFLGGTADWLELVLFVVGLAFLGVELFLLPGFGIAGLTGMLLLGASLILASQDFVIPKTDADMAVLSRTVSVLMGSLLAFFLIATLMSRYLGSLPVLSHLTLKPPCEEDLAGNTSPSDQGPAVGDTGRADSSLRPAGRARFGHQTVDVMTDGDFIDAGTAIRIVRITGSRIFVEKA